MTTKDVKNIFESYLQNEILIKNMEDRVYQLESRIKLVSSLPLTHLSSNDIKLGVDDYLSVIKKLKEEILKTQKEMKKVEELIGLVNDPLLQLILRMKYIDGKKWVYIGGKVHYCVDNCIIKRNEALKIISDKFIS